MKFSLPPHYVATPAWVILSAFESSRWALLGRYGRLLSLAWDREDRSTPVVREEDFYNTKDADGAEVKGFLDVSRRQFYEIMHEMEGMRWLRSARPRAGFVQFFFHGVDPIAENRTDIAKNRTDFDLRRIEEEESLKLKIKESSSSSTKGLVRKIALKAESETEKKMQALVENLHLLFDPERYGFLEMRPIFLAGIPERSLGWIAKAYQDRDRLVQGGGAIGLIVKHIAEQDAPNRYYINKFSEILPEVYLEAIGEIQYECEHCSETFGTRQAKNEHQTEKHPYPCGECAQWFLSSDELKRHYEQTHDSYISKRNQETVMMSAPTMDGTIQSAWQAVLYQLQLEMPRASFETWAQHTQAARYDGNTLTVTAGNQYACDWLENRLTSTVERLLIGILNQEVRVVFVVADLVESK